MVKTNYNHCTFQLLDCFLNILVTEKEITERDKDVSIDVSFYDNTNLLNMLFQWILQDSPFYSTLTDQRLSAVLFVL